LEAGGIVDIVSCPKCGRPRALGHRCPTCGDIATAVDQEPKTPDEIGPRQAEAGPGVFPTRHAVAAQTQRTSGGKKRRGRLATVIVAVVVIVIAAVVAAVLTTGGAAVVRVEASVASAPETAYDEAAKSLLRNAITVMDAVGVESGGYTGVLQATLQTMEPAIAWMPGRAGVCSSPPTGAKAQQNAVGWACTGQLSYELGIWSASGVEFGVRVDKLGGGNTYYKDGKAAAW
jgi:hypothetical protein